MRHVKRPAKGYWEAKGVAAGGAARNTLLACVRYFRERLRRTLADVVPAQTLTS